LDNQFICHFSNDNAEESRDCTANIDFLWKNTSLETAVLCLLIYRQHCHMYAMLTQSISLTRTMDGVPKPQTFKTTIYQTLASFSLSGGYM